MFYTRLFTWRLSLFLASEIRLGGLARKWSSASPSRHGKVLPSPLVCFGCLSGAEEMEAQEIMAQSYQEGLRLRVFSIPCVAKVSCIYLYQNFTVIDIHKCMFDNGNRTLLNTMDHADTYQLKWSYSNLALSLEHGNLRPVQVPFRRKTASKQGVYSHELGKALCSICRATTTQASFCTVPGGFQLRKADWWSFRVRREGKPSKLACFESYTFIVFHPLASYRFLPSHCRRDASFDATIWLAKIWDPGPHARFLNLRMVVYEKRTANPVLLLQGNHPSWIISCDGWRRCRKQRMMTLSAYWRCTLRESLFVLHSMDRKGEWPPMDQIASSRFIFPTPLDAPTTCVSSHYAMCYLYTYAITRYAILCFLMPLCAMPHSRLIYGTLCSALLCKHAAVQLLQCVKEKLQSVLDQAANCITVYKSCGCPQVVAAY